MFSVTYKLLLLLSYTNFKLSTTTRHGTQICPQNAKENDSLSIYCLKSHENVVFSERVVKREIGYLGFKWVQCPHDYYKHDNQLITNYNIFMLRCIPESQQTNQIGNKPKSPLRVTTFNFPPSTILIRKNNKLTIGSYFGHLLEVFHSEFNISFNIFECKVKQFGSFINGSWTGLIGDLVYGIADIAPSVIITKTRNDYVKFSSELYPLYYDIIYRKLDHYEWQYTLFLKPYDKNIWFCISAISLLFILVRFLSNNIYPKKLYTNYFKSFLNDFLLCWPIVTEGKIPFSSSYSMKFLLRLYLIISMLLLSIYSSLLTSWFSTLNVQVPFTTLEEMLLKTDYTLVILKGSSIEEVFLRPPYKNHEALLRINKLTEGIDIIFNTKAGLLMPLHDVQHLILNNCSFSFIPYRIRREPLSLAYAKEFVYKDYFNYKILLLKERGILSMIHNRYIPGPLACENHPFHPISFGEIIGLFIIIVCGILMSVLFVAAEIIINKF